MRQHGLVVDDRASRPRRNTRPRDALGQPMPYGTAGVDEQPAGVLRNSHESLVEADRLLRSGRPFHAHEVLEDAWKSGPEAERELWRGLAQLAVGMTHAARGNPVGAARLIERGALGIAPFEDESPHGLDIPAILGWCAQVRAELAQISYILQGSVTARRIPCGKLACACTTDVEAWHGPYIQWSRRKGGRTVSTYLTPEQAVLCREWIANYRTLDKLIDRMLKLSLRMVRFHEIPKL